jgi:hypothetical protein
MLEKSLTVSSKGRVEARVLVERGVYTIVEYRDPETMEVVEKKFKIYLRSEDGVVRGFLMIPLKGGNRYLGIEDTRPKQDLYVYNVDKGYEEPLFK